MRELSSNNLMVIFMTIKFENYSRVLRAEGDWIYYEWKVFVDEPVERISKIDSIEYRLDPSFSNPIMVVKDRYSRFSLVASGWGSFWVNVIANYIDGNRESDKYYLDLEKQWPPEDLGYHLLQKGKWSEAIKVFEDGLNSKRAKEDPAIEAELLFGLGETYSKQHRWNKSDEMFSLAKKIFSNLNDRVGEAEILLAEGELFELQANHSGAFENYKKAMDVFQEFGDSGNLGQAFFHIGGLYSKQGDINHAIEYYEKSLTAFENAGARTFENMALDRLGEIYSQEGNIKKAIENYEKSLGIKYEIGDRYGVNNVLKNLSDLKSQ